MSAGCGASTITLDAIDRLSQGDSPVHRLDPRAKLVVSLAFAITVMSLPKYALNDTLPFFIFPFFMLAQSGIPPAFIARRIAVVAPFAFMLGAVNPFLDTEIALRIGGVGVSGGWLSFISILLRFALTIGALLILVATTSVPALAQAANKLGAPKALAAQILGLYRYLFLAVEETQRMLLAWRLRAAGGKYPSWRIFAQMLGQLLLRSLARARRVHTAMLCRGFDGEIRSCTALQFSARDGVFVAGWLAAFAVLRFGHPASVIGALVLGAG
jgi:cobalt/nickel transport system permease protein